MRTQNRQLLVSVIALTTAGALVASCRESGDGDCEVGSEGCGCTSGGSCDGTLTCASNLCVDMAGEGESESESESEGEIEGAYDSCQLLHECQDEKLTNCVTITGTTADAFCAPYCDEKTQCPSREGTPAACALLGESADNCVLVCDKSKIGTSEGCPAGMMCIDLQGLGACLWQDPDPTVVVNFSGAVASISDPGGALDIAENDPAFGTYIYNALSVDSNNDADTGQYLMTKEQYGIQVDIGKTAFETDDSSTEFVVTITNGAADTLSMASINNLPLGDLEITGIELTLTDEDGVALPNDSLPTQLLNLTQFETSVVRIEGCSAPCAAVDDDFSINIDITGLSG